MICPKCTSIHTKRDGRKKTKSGVMQEYKCNACNSYFRTPLDTTVKQYDQLIEPGKIFSFESKNTTRVHCLTDVHVGANEFDSLKFQQAIDIIKNEVKEQVTDMEPVMLRELVENIEETEGV